MAHNSLRNHRKLGRLCLALDVCEVVAVGHLQFLWWAVEDDRSVPSDGSLAGWSDEDVAIVSKWSGAPAILVDGMVSSGFLDRTDAGLSVHDYSDWAPNYVNQRWKRKAEKGEVGYDNAGCGDNGAQRRTTHADARRSVPTQHNTTQRNAKEKVPQKAARAPPPKKPRKPDPIWDVVAELWYPSGVPPSEKTSVGKVVADLKAIGATPEEIRTRKARHLEEWPTLTCTPRSLVKHWDQFAEPARKVVGRVQAPRGKYEGR